MQASTHKSLSAAVAVPDAVVAALSSDLAAIEAAHQSLVLECASLRDKRQAAAADAAEAKAATAAAAAAPSIVIPDVHGTAVAGGSIWDADIAVDAHGRHHAARLSAAAPVRATSG